MFGFVSADTALLSEKDKKLYRGVYCGLCHALCSRYGSVARYTLNYDMTFLALSLSAVYGVGFEERHGKCVAHPAKKQEYLKNEILDYAADMNIILTYKNALDNWNDDKNPMALATAKALFADYELLCSKYPRQCSAVNSCLAHLSEIEKRGDPSPDAAALCFGKLLGEVFIWQEDAISERLRSFGVSLGKVIYIMDAAVDLRSDLKKQKYNPLAFVRVKREEILDMLMADCVKAYKELEIADYTAIFENILYSGIWTKYRYKKEKERRRIGKQSI